MAPLVEIRMCAGWWCRKALQLAAAIQAISQKGCARTLSEVSESSSELLLTKRELIDGG
jgi:hypothetical protein